MICQLGEVGHGKSCEWWQLVLLWPLYTVGDYWSKLFIKDLACAVEQF